MTGNTSNLQIVKARQGWSKTDLSNEFGIDRKKIDRLLKEIPARGELVRGNATFYVSDVAYVLAKHCRERDGIIEIEDRNIGLGKDDRSPEDLFPKERKEWYDGEHSRKKLLKEDGQLIPSDEVRDKLSEVFKAIKAFMLTLGDVLERDVGLPPPAVAKVIDLSERLCDRLADKLMGEGS